MRISREYLSDLLLYTLASRHVKSDVIDPVGLGDKRKIGIVAQSRIDAVSSVKGVLFIDYHAERRVVENEYLYRLFGLFDGGQLLHRHLKASVACQKDHLLWEGVQKFKEDRWYVQKSRRK